MINEDLTRKDISKIKKMIKKELNDFKKKQLEKKIKSIVKKEFKDIKDIDKNYEKKVEEISKEVLQAFFDLMYKERKIWKSKTKL
tara:strand:+ start:431 stop:685 length:255 start_codon:yes stop_codon:yes gene_type:complete